MAKTCEITGVSSKKAGGYSNRIRATEFNPSYKNVSNRQYANLQSKRIYVPELDKTYKLTLSARAIKTINKNGAFATLKKAGIIN